MAAGTPSNLVGRARSVPIGLLAVVIVSCGLSIASSSVLGETLKIRWTVGPGYHYGPTTVSTTAVLLVFPVVVATLFVVTRWLEWYLVRSDAVDTADPFNRLYRYGVVLLLVTVVAIQALLIGLNLWFP